MHRRLTGSRPKDLEGRALAWSTNQFNLPLVRAYDALYDSQAKTAARELSCKERIEDSGLCLSGYPGTGIRDFKPDVVSFAQARRRA